jgi:hypothetical protein
MTGYPFRATLLICALGAIASLWTILSNLSQRWGLAQFIAWQLLLYLIVAGYAYACRSQFRASMIVLTMSVVVASLGMLMLWRFIPMAYGGAYYLLGSIVQSVAAIYGNYVGYAFVEAARPENQGFHALRGKLVVIGIISVAAAVLAMQFAAIMP